MKKTKRVFFILLLAALLLMLLTLCACAKPEPEPGLPEWYIGLEGVSEPVFLPGDYNEMDKVICGFSITDEEGNVMEGEWEGVYLKDMLEYLGVSEYTSVTLTAYWDRSEVEFTPERVDEYAVLIAVRLDGEYVWKLNKGAYDGIYPAPFAIATQGAEIGLVSEEIKRITVNK